MGFSTKQVFVDGNKRTALLATHAFLRVNGLCLSPVADEEVAAQIERLIAREIEFTEVVFWLNELVIFPS